MTIPADDFRVPCHIRSGWNVNALILRGRLTDKRISKYQKLGYYDPAFQQARRELWERRKAKRTRREGNFDNIDGRLIFRPA